MIWSSVMGDGRPSLRGVVFETNVGPIAGSLVVPDDICDFLGIGSESEIDVLVDSANGHHGPVRRRLTKSLQAAPRGNMVYWAGPGERIVVTVLKV